MVRRSRPRALRGRGPGWRPCAPRGAPGGPMDLRKAAAVYAIGTGGTLGAIWVGLLATGHDVVSGTGVFPFTDHLVPEALTGGGLLLAGAGLLRGAGGGRGAVAAPLEPEL